MFVRLAVASLAGSVTGGTMRRSVAAMVLASVIVLAGWTAWPAVAQTGGCQLAPVFVMLRDLVGRERVGECVGGVIRNDAGDLSQQTTSGMMTFRPSDLVTQFSDGQTTWLYGPRGLESRLSASRLPWETTANTASTGSGNVTGPPPSAGAGPPPGAGPGAGPTTGSQSVTGAGVAAPQPASSPVPQIVMPIKLEGDAPSTTRPFDLAGGDYRVAWETELQKDNQSCYVGSRLRRVESTTPGALVVHVTLNSNSDRTSSGETRVFAVAPGRYVFDVQTTGCAWKITLELPR
jgi:hypothetical protein